MAEAVKPYGADSESLHMSCLLALCALAVPRIVIVGLVIFSDYIGEAYETTVWPLLGFFVMPTTTLAWAWATHSGGADKSGFEVAVIVVAVLIDLGIIGGGAKSRRDR